MFLMGTATTVDEAVALEKAGVDAVVTQGSEAGGPPRCIRGRLRGGDGGNDRARAAGGQRGESAGDCVRRDHGRAGIAAALALGASAVQMGTAFLTCDEAGIAEAYKQAILAAREHETRLTWAFSGRPARGSSTAS